MFKKPQVHRIATDSDIRRLDISIPVSRAREAESGSASDPCTCRQYLRSEPEVHTIQRRDSRLIRLSGLTGSTIAPFKIQRPSESQVPDAMWTIHRSHDAVAFVCSFFFPSEQITKQHWNPIGPVDRFMPFHGHHRFYVRLFGDRPEPPFRNRLKIGTIQIAAFLTSEGAALIQRRR
jgi:hypothetical protein